jgi:hypothetical protein
VVLAADAPPRIVPIDVAVALDTLRTFATLADHERNVRARVKAPDRAEVAVALLREIANSDAVVRSAGLADMLRGAEEDTATPPIRTLAVVTCDRPGMLQCSLDAFLTEATRERAHLRVVVGDDTRSSSAMEATKTIVEDACGRHGARQELLSRAERAAFAGRIARVSGVDADLVNFALLGDDAIEGTIGANRNSVLLVCGAEPTLWFDDDVLPTCAAPPRTQSGVAYRAVDPTEWRFFNDRDEARAGVRTIDCHLLTLHEQFLGRSLAGAGRGAEVDVDDATTEMIRDAYRRRGRIVTTLTGVFGDSGMYSGAALLTTANEAARRAFLADAATYETAFHRREVLRAAPCVSIAHPMPFMATSFALHAHRGTPPFLPVLRNEDGVFGATLARCFEGAYAAHLPVALLHDAPAGRTYVRDRIAAAGVHRLSDVVCAFVAAHPFVDGEGDGEYRLRALGTGLRALGEMHPRDHRAAVRSLLLRAASVRATKIQMLLDTHSRGPSYWIADLRAQLSAIHDKITRKHNEIADDLTDGRTPEDAMKVGQRVLRNFGRLLEAWPAIVAAARTIRSD